MSKLIGKTIIEIFKNQKKSKQIFEINEKNIKPKVDSIINNIIFSLKEIGEEIKKKLFGQLYDNPAKKLGNIDAGKIIEKYLKGEFSFPLNKDDFSKCIVNLEEETLDLLTIESIDKSNDISKNKKKITNNNCTCLIF